MNPSFLSLRSFASLRFPTCFFLAALTIAANVDAQDRFIKVTGKATASAKPEFVLLRATLSGSAATSEKSLKKLTVIHEEFSQAINPMDFEGVTVEYSPIQFKSGGSEMMDMGFFVEGEGMEEPELPVVSTQEAVIYVALEDGQIVHEKISSVIDAAMETKAKFGGSSASSIQAMYMGGEYDSSIFSTGIKDTKPLENDALKKAMEDARAQADQLAELANVKVTGVISIDSRTADYASSDFEELLMGADESGPTGMFSVSKTIEVSFAIGD